MPLPHVCRLAFSFAALCLALSAAAQPISLTPLKPSGIYERGEKAGWTVTLPPGSKADGVTYTYTLKKNNLGLLESGSLDLRSGADTIITTLDEPAMLYLKVWSSTDEKNAVVAGAAIAPTQLAPSVPRPADFDEFWNAKVKMLKDIPPEPVVTPGESQRDGVEYATVKLKNIQGAHVYGQLAKPARPGKFPAMLILQWAGGPYPLEKPWVTDRAAEGWLALNVGAHDVPGDLPPEFYAALPAMLKSYNTIENDNRDRNYFLRMYLGAYRGADYLTSHPDWDGKTLLVMGTSMGGQQSLAVAALYPQITHLIVHVPAGADSNGARHGRLSGYPNWEIAQPGVKETALYFDTVNFASRIKARCLISMGFIDNVCPPAGIWIAYNQITAPKEVVPLVNAAHNHESTAEQQQAYTERSHAWLASLLKGEEPALQSNVPQTDK
jgi:cephalosporin-C deacetylase-like acetyl esterase